MRFSDNGYYIEAYIKCNNCGVLLYHPAREVPGEGDTGPYCSEWCRDWAALRASGAENPFLPLPKS